jgi:hypothetical protein
MFVLHYSWSRVLYKNIINSLKTERNKQNKQITELTVKINYEY